METEQTNIRDWIKQRLSQPAGLLMTTFAVLIILGWILLALPVSHANKPISILDALFTATSAVCVTGLIVVDTGKDFSFFGQCVILGLIQLGGLGIMTFAAIGLQVLGRSISFRHSASLADVFYQAESAANIRRDLKWIVGLTLAIETLGTVLLCWGFRGTPDDGTPVFASVFHAISAFCNAGFSLHTDSLMSYHSHGGVMLVIMMLIIVGGLGHTTLVEMVRRTKRRLSNWSAPYLAWSANSKTVLSAAAVLVVAGAVLLLVTGINGKTLSFGSAMDALFQSVTSRTAGFNSVDIAALPAASLLILLTLMFIGGAPGSCAGGIKTTTVALAIAYLRARLTGRQDVTLFRRRVAQRTISRMVVLIALALAWNAVGCVILAATELNGETPYTLNDILFEQVSAFATVGLSTGITPALSTTGKLWIILTMFVGRLGPLTAALAVVTPTLRATRYAESHVMIG